jgi:hypothetical protein
MTIARRVCGGGAGAFVEGPETDKARKRSRYGNSGGAGDGANGALDRCIAGCYSSGQA